MTGADVGVVVVGETPYSEGFGDVGGPECGFCSPEQLEEKSLSLLPGDKAVVDTVCDAIATCVVVVVSGRPQVLTDQLSKMDALVASWLPGSEGAGVADVLFGERPFTGKLPMTWPRSEAQVPINVGDATTTRSLRSGGVCGPTSYRHPTTIGQALRITGGPDSC